MRILVLEFATGGGMAGTPVDASLESEGRAMRDALAADLAAERHHVLVSLDPRFEFSSDAAVVGKIMPSSAEAYGPALERLIDQVDAVWLIAPETGGCHEDIARRVEGRGKPLLGSGSDSIRTASDKAGLGERLEGHGVAYPATVRLPRSTDPDVVARVLSVLTFPVVVKPRRGAGSEGVFGYPDMDATLDEIDRLPVDGLAQEYLSGTAVSVSVLTHGTNAVVVAVNSQELAGNFRYSGGVTPFDHPDAALAARAALRACGSVPGLRGYVGVDLVIGPRGPVVIEINPRLTTAYLGIRCAIEENLAALAIDAVHGTVPTGIRPARCVRFSEAGEILSSEPLRVCS
jgi:predicted ATP-grasp superfamily ATP-dependent carboligase